MIKTVLQRLDQRLGNPLAAFRERYQFRQDRLKRQQQYQDRGFSFQSHADVIQQLNRDGFAILKGVVQKSFLDDIRREFEELLDSGRLLDRPAKDSARTPGDLSSAKVFLTNEELGQ